MNDLYVGGLATYGLKDGRVGQTTVLSCAAAGCLAYLITDVGCQMVHLYGVGAMPVPLWRGEWGMQWRSA